MGLFRRAGVAAVGLTLASSGLAAVAPAAHAATGCATRAELHRVHDGMSYTRVGRILGTRGRIIFRNGGGEVVRYRLCAGGHRDMYYNEVGFWKLIDKTANNV